MLAQVHSSLFFFPSPYILVAWGNSVNSIKSPLCWRWGTEAHFYSRKNSRTKINLGASCTCNKVIRLCPYDQSHRRVGQDMPGGSTPPMMVYDPLGHAEFGMGVRAQQERAPRSAGRQKGRDTCRALTELFGCSNSL